MSYFGGKSRLVKTILPLIPEHTAYVEPFCGAAWLLFAKDEQISRSKIINDINSDLTTLYRVLAHHLDEFMRYFRWIIVSREEFERFKAANPDTLTDIQRAVRFYYLQKLCYAGKVSSRHFAVAPTARPSLNLMRIEEELSAVHLRLARVYVENLPYHKLIPRYDRPETFFYIDPPYHTFEKDYGAGIFGEEDFERLRGLLEALSGKFMLSINDTPFIRQTFQQFHIKEVETTWCASPTQKKAAELLVTNYPLG